MLTRSQRTRKDADIEAEKKDARFHEGKDNSHKANDASTWHTNLADLVLVTDCHDQRMSGPLRTSWSVRASERMNPRKRISRLFSTSRTPRCR